MLRLTDHLKQDVLFADGARAGRVRDLAVDLGESFPRVTRIVVGGGKTVRFVRWGALASFERSEVTLSVREDQLEDVDEALGELWLARDVLDSQIVDIDGKRVARVGEVELAREGRELRCVGVETGIAAVARRVGLTRVAKRLPSRVVAWDDMHIASGRGHALQLGSTAARVHALSAEELMHLVGRLSVRHGVEVLDTAPAAAAAGALGASRPDVAGTLLTEMDQDRAAALLAAMPVDDAAAALRPLRHDDAAPLLEGLDTATATQIRALLAHPAGSAGAVMVPEARTARVGEPLERVRDRLAAAPPALDGQLTVVVVDEGRHPQGVLPAATVLAARGDPVPVPAVRTDAPIERVMELFATYDVLAVPVVDEDGVLVGIVAVDDILDELLVEHLPGERRYRVMSARTRAPA